MCLQSSSRSNSVMRLINSSCDSRPLLPILLYLLPSIILKSPKSIRLFFRVIFLWNYFLIFLVNIFLSMRRSFIVLEGAYNAKTASAVFLILKKTYLPAGSVIICSIGWAVLFASTKTPRVYVFPGKIKTSPSQSSLMSCRWEKFTCVSCKMKKSEFNVLQ